MRKYWIKKWCRILLFCIELINRAVRSESRAYGIGDDRNG